VRGVYGLAATDAGFLHQYFYYLRHAGGWDERPGPGDPALARALFVRGEERPVAIQGRVYSEYLAHNAASAGPMPRGLNIGGIVVLLPGPYAACSTAVPEGRH
jgi:hypothetical protein